MNKTSFLIIGAICSLCISRGPAFATDIEYCNQHYSNVDAVFWNTKTVIEPAIVGTEWADVDRGVAGELERLISKNSTLQVTQTSDTAEQVLAAHPDSLYLSVVFSYASKDKFTTPLDHDALVIWVETTRNEPSGKQGETEPITKRSRTDLFLLPDNSRFGGHLVKFGSPFFYGPKKLLLLESCSILAYSSTRSCTDPPDPVKNKIIEYQHTCAKGPTISPTETDPEKIYRAMKNDSNISHH